MNVHNNHYPRTEVWYMDNTLSITRLSASWKHNCRVAYPEAIKWHTVNLKHLKRCEISDNSHRTTFAILAMSSHHISVLHGAVQSHHACGNILFFHRWFLSQYIILESLHWKFLNDVVLFHTKFAVLKPSNFSVASYLQISTNQASVVMFVSF